MLQTFDKMGSTLNPTKTNSLADKNILDLANSMDSLQPGIRFYKALCNLSKPIYKYGLRIPQTYYAEEGKLLVFDETRQCLSRVDLINDEAFKSRLEIEAMQNMSSRPDEPAYVFHKRNCSSPKDFTTKSVYFQYIEKSIGSYNLGKFNTKNKNNSSH